MFHINPPHTLKKKKKKKEEERPYKTRAQNLTIDSYATIEKGESACYKVPLLPPKLSTLISCETELSLPFRRCCP